MTEDDKHALSEMPKTGWFSPWDVMVKNPQYRCDRLEMAGVLESRIVGDFPHRLRKEYRRISRKPMPPCER